MIIGSTSAANKRVNNVNNIARHCKMVNSSNPQSDGGNDANLGIAPLAVISLKLNSGAHYSWQSKSYHSKNNSCGNFCCNNGTKGPVAQSNCAKVEVRRTSKQKIQVLK